MFHTINPVDNKIIEKYRFFSKKEIDIKLYKSLKAYIEWKKLSFQERIMYIKKLYTYIRKYSNTLSSLITREMGKPILQSKLEINKSLDLCNYYCNLKEEFLIQNINIFEKKNENKYCFIAFEPIGTILGITPWNYPIWQIIRSSIPNLILGNVVLIKPALNTAGSSIVLEEIFIKSGFPIGIFQILLIKTNDVEYVISNDIVQGISFTGSTLSGKSIGSLSGKYIKKSILELGGNDAFIVLKDVKNIKKIAKIATESRLDNTGQTCISAKRFIIDVSIIDDFIDLVINEMNTFIRGDLYDESTKIGYISRSDLSDKLYKQYKNIICNGGKICLKTIKDGNYFSPSLLRINKKDIMYNQEEIFGPIATIIPFSKEEEISSIVNKTIYGLGASIWTSDINKAKSLSKDIDTGMIFINQIVKSDPRIPFGGIKKSGYGRELSIYSIKEFSNWKTMVIKN
ncbi:aldehyde dehydrogenase family protein [Blattabacterium cuenoti]|uniref:aldehyde dehydrogenase family protein n=1 Tax=Blattabacterium cuenoti TaxID=1653831 RepID=UPI00163CF160|nr:aldehyde dehydrogenase family protein [Blattabacterium cuenoti]